MKYIQNWKITATNKTNTMVNFLQPKKITKCIRTEVTRTKMLPKLLVSKASYRNKLGIIQPFVEAKPNYEVSACYCMNIYLNYTKQKKGYDK